MSNNRGGGIDSGISPEGRRPRKPQPKPRTKKRCIDCHEEPIECVCFYTDAPMTREEYDCL